MNFKKIKAISTRIVNGSMGNSMFFLATAIAHAKRNKTNFAVPENIRLLQPLFKYDFTKHIVSDKTLGTLPQYTDPAFHYTEIPASSEVLLNYGPGYYQSWKYFDDIKSDLKEYYFTPSKQVDDFINNEYNDLDNSVALHIRMGDYRNFPHHPIQKISYYSKAVDLFPNASQIIVFSNEPLWCREHIIFDKRIIFARQVTKPHDGRVDDSWDYRNGVDMFVMSKCSGHIIANSSYSWWGAYLSNSKKVVYPSHWFDGPLSKYDTSDICPPDWIRLDE